MRLVPIILLLLVTCSATAQVRDNRINLALLHYDLTQTKLDFSEYELYLSAMISIGDKSIVLEEIFKSILKRKDFSLEDSLFAAWTKDIGSEDSIRVNKLPQLIENWPETIFYTVRMAYLTDAYMKKITLSDAYLKLMEHKPVHFPHLPPENSKYSSQLIQLVEKYYLHLVWFREHPDELSFFLDLLRRHAQTLYGEKDDENLRRLVEHVTAEVKKNQSTDVESIPYTLGQVMHYFNSLRQKRIALAEFCNEKQIDKFVEGAYALIYDEAPPMEIKNDLVKFIRSNELYDAELIYLALIMSYYE